LLPQQQSPQQKTLAKSEALRIQKKENLNKIKKEQIVEWNK
jgi:hypothetical protein